MPDFMIRFPSLIVGIVAGFIILRVYNVQKPIFFRWPTPDNVGKVHYKDRNGTCYEYNSNQVDCNANKDKIKPMPLQVQQPFAVMS